MHVLDAPATCIVSVKLPIVLLRFIQRNSKALNYSDLSRPTIILDLSLQRQDQVSVYVYILCHRASILLCECVFPCWTPTELVYPVWLYVSMLDSHRDCISSCVNAGLPQSLYILFLCECVFPCWTSSHGACTMCTSCVNVCFHARLPLSL